jgi:hypothetical protein
MEEQEPNLSEIDLMLGHMSELLKDPKLNPRRRLLILGSIDDLLDIRASHSSLQNLNYVASPA